MSDMLKRVGAAILEAESRWTPKSDEPKERVMARAGLEAMRDAVTKEMVVAGEAAIEDFKDSDWDSGGDGESRNTYTYFRPGVEVAVYKAMIDAALTHPVQSPNPSNGEGR